MGEKFGFLGVLAVVLLLVVPFTLNLYDKQVKANKLMSLSNEVRQMIIAEGGVSDSVNSVVNDFSEKGITIEFKDKEGQTITGLVNPGEVVNIELEYDDFQLGSSVVVTKRH